MELEPRNIRGIVFHLDPSLKSLLAEIVAPIGGFAIFPCALPDRGFSLLRFEHWHRAPRLRFQPLATVRPGILISYAEKIDLGAVSESNRKKFNTPYPLARGHPLPLPYDSALGRAERSGLPLHPENLFPYQALTGAGEAHRQTVLPCQRNPKR